MVKSGKLVPAKKKYKGKIREKKLSCDYENCDFRCAAPSEMVKHIRKHTGERPFICDFLECGKGFTQKSAMIIHKRRHLKDKIYSCVFPECDFKAVSKSAITLHSKTHSDARPHVCTFELESGVCGCAFSDPYALKRHVKTHTSQHDFSCDICDFTCVRASSLTIHMRTHTNERPFPCPREGCDYRSADHSSLVKHVRIHDNIKPFSCDFPGCDYAAAESGTLTRHKRVHTGEKPYICDFPGCDFRGAESKTLRYHKTTHSLLGQIRRKKQENRVNNLLGEWGFTVDRELTINASIGECLSDTPRHFSRIDFVIVNCVNAIVLLEVDEDQHYWYNLSCEFSRMSDVRASLIKSGYTLPIYWIRYNPNGKYHVDSEQVKMYRPKREMELKRHIQALCSPGFKPVNQVNIHYMFYDLIDAELGPQILLENDFPDALRDCVTWFK